MLHTNWLKTGFTVLTVASMAGAHLFADGLKPTAGESVSIGQTYSITWKEQFNHAKGTDIDLSVDGGNTWTTIKKDFADAQGDNKYNWTVAGSATATAKIRICQHDGGTVKACTDNDKTNSLSSAPNGNYVLISGAFTLSTGTGIVRNEAAASGFSVAYRPGTRNVDVSFGLAESGPVLLQAFDTRGRLAATLVQGDFAAGSHKLSLFSDRLDASGSALVFKLKAGDQVRSQTWTPVR